MFRSHARRSRPLRILSGQRGFSLVEALLASGFVTLALLGHVASTFAGHRLSRTERTRSVALEFVRDFIERMRSDEDWVGLYPRLRTKLAPAENHNLLAGTGPALDLESVNAYEPTAYYDDLEVPASLGSPRVLVQVPYDASLGAPTLRESSDAPAFGLPYDLNGDGRVDSASCTGDYLILPIVVTLRCTPPGEAAMQIRVPAWLRGERQ